ncbi:hypothetical protein HNR22_002340 [Micromonospora jinlongensis]|uniref:Uncharacterized protein n=1 Tax=Micromonospora jinlongensis TaxID=1287877 RepID=A0A7Z0BCV3_9ACTN|nr:hypothetical protein [Micromonospora jinlongensis]NYH42613.1 hypothetical protein [Micromonospora jinlongensis]
MRKKLRSIPFILARLPDLEKAQIIAIPLSPILFVGGFLGYGVDRGLRYIGYSPIIPLWVALPCILAFSLAVAVRAEALRLSRLIRFWLESLHGGPRSAKRREVGWRLTALVCTDAFVVSAGLGTIIVLIGPMSSLYPRLLPTGEPSNLQIAAVVGATCAVTISAIWVLSIVERLLLSRAPYLQALRTLDSLAYRAEFHSVASPDPLGPMRRSLIGAAHQLERCARQLELDLPDGNPSAVGALFYGSAARLRRFVGSRESLSLYVPIEVTRTVELSVLLLLETQREEIYEEAADLWEVFDKDGLPNFPRRHVRFARLRSRLSSLGRGIEPTGKSVQTLAQVGVVLLVIFLFVSGEIDLVAVIKKLIQ